MEKNQPLHIQMLQAFILPGRSLSGRWGGEASHQFRPPGALPEARCLGPGSVSNASASQAQADTWLCPAAFWRPSRKPSSFPLGSLSSSLVPVHTARPLEAWRTQASAVSLFPGGLASSRLRGAAPAPHTRQDERSKVSTACPVRVLAAVQTQRSTAGPGSVELGPRAARLIITFQAPRFAQHEREHWEQIAQQPDSSIAQALVTERSPAISCDAPAPFSLACGVCSSTPGYLACCLGDRSESQEDASPRSQHWQALSPMYFRMPCDGALRSQLHCMLC